MAVMVVVACRILSATRRLKCKDKTEGEETAHGRRDGCRWL